MSRNRTAVGRGRITALVTAAEWFAGGQRIPYDPDSARVLTEEEAAVAPGALRVFERVAAAEHGRRTPCGSRCCPDSRTAPTAGPRWTGCSATTSARGCTSSRSGRVTRTSPGTTAYSTIERADLVEALWRHHGVRRTVVVTFDYTSLALLELLRRQLERDHSGDTPGRRSRPCSWSTAACSPTRTPTRGRARRCCAPRWAHWGCGGRSARRACSTRR